MKQIHAVMAIVVAVSILGGSIFTMAATSSFGSDNQLTTTGFAPITGHVTLTVYDQFGNIKHYQETDNDIVNLGENCIAEYMFGVTTSPACALTASFLTVHVGTGAATADGARGTTVAMVAGGTKQVDGSGANLTQSSTGTDEALSASSAILEVEATFPTPSSQAIYTEAALSNGTDFMAYQALSAATIETTDSLTVKWTINIGP